MDNIEEESYLDRILNYFIPRQMNQPSTMEYASPPVQQFSSPSIEELKRNNAIYGDETDYNPLTGKLYNAPPEKLNKNIFPYNEPLPVRPLPSSFTKRTNVLAPFGTTALKSFSPSIPIPPEESVQNQTRPSENTQIQKTEPVTPVNIEQPKPSNSIFDSISNTLKDVSKSASETFKDPNFREGLGGMLVALGAGFQGQDAGKALERYESILLNNKEEARRRVLEEERRVKNDPKSTWNLTYREMFKKYVPGVDRLMGDAFNNMTEEMLKSSYPMISNGIKNMTEKEMADPLSQSSVDAVRSYNEMIKSFNGKIPPLEEGKISARQVDNHMSNINNVLRSINDENEKVYRENTLKQQGEQKGLDRALEREIQGKNLAFKEKQLAHERGIDYAKLNLERQKFEEMKRRSAEAAKLASQRLSQSGAGIFSDKERAKMAIQYPLGLALQPAETAKLTKMGAAYNKMEQALNSLQNAINKYGAPINPSAQGYLEINSAWGNFMTALKDAEEMGALDKGVENSAKSVLPKPTDFNAVMRMTGGEGKVKQSTLSVLNNLKDKYKNNYALNTAMYGYNPNIGAGENIRLMDEFIDPNTPDDRRKQIFSHYSKFGYSPDAFRTYADNYETRRRPIIGVR